jgi:hypothetical protein
MQAENGNLAETLYPVCRRDESATTKAELIISELGDGYSIAPRERL